MPATEADALTTLLRALGRSVGGASPGVDVGPALAVPEALGAFADQVVAQALTSPEGLAGFVDALEAEGHRSAATEVLRSRVAEWEGDIGATEAQVAQALRRDPRHPVALLDAALVASARGRGDDARRLLHRAGADDEPLAVLLARSPAPPGGARGRNQPCGCGSGRKHKHCCLGTSRLPLAQRTVWLHRKALEHALRPPQRQALLAVAAAFAGAGAPDTPPPEAVLAAACDALVADLALWEGGVLDGFVATWGPLLPPDERSLVERWTTLRHRLWDLPGDGRAVAADTGDELPAPPDTPAGTVLAVGDTGGPVPGFVGDARPVPATLVTPLEDLLGRGPGAVDLAAALGAHVGWTAAPDHRT